MTTAAEHLQVFLDLVFSGRLDDAIALVHPNARFVSGRPVANPKNALQGTFTGPDGARLFFQGFTTLLKPGLFQVEGRISDGNQTCFYGILDHEARTTGRRFVSDWALVARFEGPQIVFYHFYEDTDALREALS